MSDAPQSGKMVGALVSGLSIVRYLSSAGGPVGVSRIAKDLQLNPSTCFNLLKTLVHERLVSFDDLTKTYTVGLGLVEMAKGVLEQASYVRMIHPYLEAIAAEHRVTATLWQRVPGDRVVLVDRADNLSAVRVHMSIGQRLPMFVAALGRCMAAYSGLSERDLKLRFDQLRWDNSPSFESYLKDVAMAKAQGFAIDPGTYSKGVTTVSAPVLDLHGRPVMAISAVGFSAQMTDASLLALGEDLKARAAEVSRAMSGGQRRFAGL